MNPVDPPSVTLNVPEGWSVPETLVERAVRMVLKRESVSRGEFCLTFLRDAEARELNRRWLEHDWVPDVLSFALHEPGSPPLGDVYVGIEQAHRQAESLGVPAEEEIVRLAVHGTLHVLGYDHGEEEAERSDGDLYRLQEAIVREALRRTPAEEGRDRAAPSDAP